MLTTDTDHPGIPIFREYHVLDCQGKKEQKIKDRNQKEDKRQDKGKSDTEERNDIKQGYIRGKLRKKLDSSTEIVILFYNLGGSRSAMHWLLLQDAHILMIQEHRYGEGNLSSAQTFAKAYGWDGIWTAADSYKQGRSGGVAILARAPLMVYKACQDPHARYIQGVIQWTRTHRLVLGTVYGYDSNHPQREEGNSQLYASVTKHIHELGRVPWLIAGDFNMEPREAIQHLPAGNIIHTGNATHNQGHELDYGLRSHNLDQTHIQMSTTFPEEGHYPICFKIPKLNVLQLGQRLRKPKQVPPKEDETVGDMAWNLWNQRAETCLLRMYDCPGQEFTGRGAATMVANTLSALRTATERP